MNGYQSQYYSDTYLPNYYHDVDSKLLISDALDLYHHTDKLMTTICQETVKRRRESVESEDDILNRTTLVSTQDQKKFLKQNHSEIEKRRRDKMNTFISELSKMIPSCVAMSKKTDKLTILRLAVQHIRAIHSNMGLESYQSSNFKPQILSDMELKNLITPNCDGFLFVADSARGRILYISENVTNTLHFLPQELTGQSLFDILHPKDIAKIKEQLNSGDISTRLVDSKTMLPVPEDMADSQSIGRLHPGARRMFLCRMKSKQQVNTILKEESDSPLSSNCNKNNNPNISINGKRKKNSTIDKKYISIQCTGYLKSWSLTKVGMENDLDGDDSALSCLVAVARPQPLCRSIIENCRSRSQDNYGAGVQFTSRHAADGKFSFVDPNTTLILGYLGQELIGSSLYEHIHFDDIPMISEYHKRVLKSRDELMTPCYRFKSKDGQFLTIESKLKQFINPWTKELEYIICKHKLVISDQKLGSVATSTEYGTNNRDPHLNNSLHQHKDLGLIGQRIADEFNVNCKVIDTDKRSTTVVDTIQNGDSKQQPNRSNSGTMNYCIIRIQI